MGTWYELGVTLGMGVALGVALVGILAGLRFGWVLSLVGAVGIGIAAGLLVRGWLEAGGGVAGGIVGALSAAVVAYGAQRRGATVGGTAFILVSAGLAIALVSLIPVAGYVVTALVPAAAARRRAREPERFAGLRTLAK